MNILEKGPALKALGVSEKNMGCTEAQIVVLTHRIQTIAEHLKVNKKDFSAKRSLMCLLGQRRALLRYCARKDNELYKKVLSTVGMRR